MPITKTKTVGSGVSERRKTQTFYQLKDPENLDGPPNLEEGDKVVQAFQRRNKIIHQPWAGQSHVIMSARKRLDEILAETPDIMEDLDGYNAVFQERDSEAWYLDRVNICAKVAEMAIDGGRPWEAAEQAMLIGEYLTELRLKYDFDEYVEKAMKAEANRLAANRARRKNCPERRFEQVMALKAKGKSLRNAFRIVADREGSHRSTIENDYYSYKKRPKSMD